MNNMKINRLKIVNYKLFQNVTIEMNENINIFVGENDSGKSTILETLSMVLTGKINGSSVANRLNLDWFNAQVRQKFKESIEAGNASDLPTIEIEVYFASPDEDEIAIKKYRGTNNSLHEDAEGVKLEIIFDTQYAPAYTACQRSLAIVQAFWYNGEKEDRREEEWNSGNRITGETW